MTKASMVFHWLIAHLVPVPSFQSHPSKYTVHMRNQDKPSYATHHDWHSSQLQYDSSLLYTYTVTYHGFAASFDSNQADSHTTRARKFLDLNTEFDSHNTQVLNQASKRRHNWSFRHQCVARIEKLQQFRFTQYFHTKVRPVWVRTQFQTHFVAKKLIAAWNFSKDKCMNSGWREDENHMREREREREFIRDFLFIF